MTRKEFKALLDNHDWYYMQSDDRRTYEKGLESANKIRKALEESPKWQSLYDKAKPKP